MARVVVGIRHAFHVGHGQHAIHRVEVGRTQRILHQVCTQLNIVVGAIHAAVVDEYPNATARNRRPVVAGRDLRVEAQAFHAGQVGVVEVFVVELLVDEQRAHGRISGQSVYLRGRGQYAGNGQRLHGDATRDAQLL